MAAPAVSGKLRPDVLHLPVTRSWSVHWGTVYLTVSVLSWTLWYCASESTGSALGSSPYRSTSTTPYEYEYQWHILILSSTSWPHSQTLSSGMPDSMVAVQGMSSTGLGVGSYVGFSVGPRPTFDGAAVEGDGEGAGVGA